MSNEGDIKSQTQPETKFTSQTVNLGKGETIDPSKAFNDNVDALGLSEKLRLDFKQWGYEHPNEYKNFIRAEYLRVFNMKKISKQKGKYVTFIIFGIFAWCGYEAVNMMLQLGLPSLLK